MSPLCRTRALPGGSLSYSVGGAESPYVAGPRLAALETGSEGVVRQTLAVALPHLGRYVREPFSAARGMEGRDEPASIVILVGREVAAGLLVMLLLRIADSDPPALARRIQVLGSRFLESLPGRLRLMRRGGEDEYDASAVREGVFVEVELVLRQTFLGLLL